MHDINKWGGYNSIKGSYFVLVESKYDKGEKLKTIEYNYKIEQKNTFNIYKNNIKGNFLTKFSSIIISNVCTNIGYYGIL